MDIENKCLDTKRGAGWDELVYTLCVKEITNENLLCNTGNPTQCSEWEANKKRENICTCMTCIQISQEAGQVVRYSHLFKNFPQFVVISQSKALVQSIKQK